LGAKRNTIENEHDEEKCTGSQTASSRLLQSDRALDRRLMSTSTGSLKARVTVADYRLYVYIDSYAMFFIKHFFTSLSPFADVYIIVLEYCSLHIQNLLFVSIFNHLIFGFAILNKIINNLYIN
jgi:hypothetical protein